MKITLTLVFYLCFQISFGQGLSLTLSPSNFNGVNVSCFGAKDGSIDLTVVGGLGPYNYSWSNGSNIEDIVAISAGYYRVTVTDRNGLQATAELTLTQPEPLTYDHIVSSYPNGYNISCNSCFNGSIILFGSGGISPYSYNWEDGPTTSDRFNLGAGTYYVRITDANGCNLDPALFLLNEPERTDWNTTGNQSINSSQHFLGTKDSSSLVFKTNNTTRLKIDGVGDITLNAIPSGMLYLDQAGKIKSNIQLAPCNNPTPNAPPIWNGLMSGELFTCPPFRVGVGTYLIPSQVKFMVSGNTYLDGQVGIGIDPVSAPVASGSAPYKLLVNGKLGANEIYCSLGTPEWPDYVFKPEYKLMTITDLKEFIQTNQHLPGVKSAIEIKENGINVSEQLVKAYEKIEELYLYLFELENRIKALEGN